MTLDDECRLSFYKEVADINKEHRVTLVQNTESKKFYVKKVMKLYSRDVFFCLYEHPVEGLPEIKDIFEDDNDLVVIEEYVAGKTLDEVLSKGTLPWEEAKNIITKLCYILEKLHSQDPRIIHRDIKPSNIVLCGNGEIKLLDMNAAKFHRKGETADTTLMGTVDYAAPEQYGFSQSDVTTDIYALGVLLNVMLVGDFPKNKMVEGDVGKIIKKCIAMEASKRFKSVRELTIALYKTSYDKKHNKPRVKLKFAPVGFRTLQWWKIIIAVLFYIAFWQMTRQVALGTDTLSYVYKFMIYTGILAGIFFLFDYGDIQEILNMHKIKKIGLRNFLKILIAALVTGFPIAYVAVMTYFANYNFEA